MHNTKMFKLVNTMLVFATLSAVPACAGSNRPGGGGGRPQGPPPEAIEACEDKAEGDTVSFAGRGGDSISATCQMVDDQLVAVPEGRKAP